MLDAGKLATLRAVVEHGSFSAAAAELALTQPAVSRQVSALEAQAGTQLLRRTRQGVQPTEAGRVLVAHADAVVGRLALAEQELSELAGLRRGHVRLGSFFTALVHVSAQLSVVLEERHPDLFRMQPQVIEDRLVDRRAAFRGLAAGELDLAVVFEHSFEPDPAPADVELVPLFTDRARVLLPARHRLARARAVRVAELAGDTWIRGHQGSAARLVDRVLAEAGIDPPLLLAGHGDEPVESQAFVAAGRGVTLAHELNVLVAPEVIAVPVRGDAPVRHVQAALMPDQRAPVVRAALEALREVGRRR